MNNRLRQALVNVRRLALTGEKTLDENGTAVGAEDFADIIAECDRALYTPAPDHTNPARYGIDDHLVDQPCPPGWVGIGQLDDEGQVEGYILYVSPEWAVRVMDALNGAD